MSITAETVESTLPANDAPPVHLDGIAEAIADIAKGRPVVVVDDANRENEGDLIFAAEAATPELLAFTIRYTSGIVCVPMMGADLDRLHLPLMTARNEESLRTAYTITVDARTGVSTGISAADRTHTIQLLADPSSVAEDLVRPGHVLPLRYHEGGVLARRGHTEAAIDLARAAGMRPAGVLAEIVNDDGTMARLPRLREFADEHDLKLVSIEQLVNHRRQTEILVERAVETHLPNRYGRWRAIGYRSSVDAAEHMALVYGDLGDGTDVLARVHSECLTGDAFGSHRCDCGTQLNAAMAAIAEEGRGVLVYLRGHEGRGIGLLQKLEAYRLQDSGADTVEANLRLGLPADAREFATGAQILADLGVTSVRLLSNNPRKLRELEHGGITVTGRVTLPTVVTPDNLRYLETKRDRLGHDLPDITTI